jgi:hypothetical protein
LAAEHEERGGNYDPKITNIATTAALLPPSLPPLPSAISILLYALMIRF